MSAPTLAEMATEVLSTRDGYQKTAVSRRHAATWLEMREKGNPLALGQAEPPLCPARPDKPALLDPRDTPRRHLRSVAARITASTYD